MSIAVQLDEVFPMLKRNLMISLMMAAATFAGLGLSAYATDDSGRVRAEIAATESRGAALADQVETLLRTDIGLAGSRLRVLGHAEVITIAGTVPDEYALRRVMDIASSVRGVREVRNQMAVESPK